MVDLPEPRDRAVRNESRDGRIRLTLLIGALVSFGLIGGLSGLVVVLSIIAMLVLHELGHFLVARWAGMQVTEFFLGFGPRLWSVRRGETTYGVKAIPAGAYVRITGMNSLDVVDPADEQRTYRQQSYPKRMAVVLAGSATHFAIALFLLVVVYAVVGTPDPDRWVVGEVVPGSTAAAVDVRAGDRILSVDGVETTRFDEFGTVVRSVPGDLVDVVVQRDGEAMVHRAVIGERVGVDGVVTGFFGVGADRPLVTMGPIRATGEAAVRFADLAWMSVKGLVGLVKGLVGFVTPDGLADFFAGAVGPSEVTTGGPSTVPDNPSAPVVEPAADPTDDERLLSIYGVARLGSAMFDDGWSTYVWFLILVNVFFGVFNLVPLLPFDGGHVAIATYERVRSIGGRRHMADLSRLMPLTWAVVSLLVAVFVVALYRDIVDFPDFG